MLTVIADHVSHRGNQLPQNRHVRTMQLSAKADYAVRASIHLARHPEGPVKAEAIATAQEIPQQFLESILSELRRAGFVTSLRGASGGHRLNRDPADISVADVVRAVDGPITTVRGQRVEDITYRPDSLALRTVWLAARSSLRDVLEGVSLADLAAQQLPAYVEEISRTGLVQRPR